MFSPAKLTTNWAYGDGTMRVQHVRNVAECSRMVRCPWWWLLWSEHSMSEGTGLRKLTSHNLRFVCWTGMVNRNCARHCPTRTWVPQSMFMLHTEMSGGRAQKLILWDYCFIVCRGTPLSFDMFLWNGDAQKWMCVCVCMCVFLFLSLYIQTVSNKGSILETLT